MGYLSSHAHSRRDVIILAKASHGADERGKNERLAVCAVAFVRIESGSCPLIVSREFLGRA